MYNSLEVEVIHPRLTYVPEHFGTLLSKACIATKFGSLQYMPRPN